jgi:hypothetical protein
MHALNTMWKRELNVSLVLPNVAAFSVLLFFLLFMSGLQGVVRLRSPRHDSVTL